MTPATRHVVSGAVVGLAASLLVLGADRVFTYFSTGGVQILQAIELKTYDWRLSWTARPEHALKNIALVEIDEYSLRNLQPNAGRWPWPRIVHSELIDYLARGPAKVVAYDIDFAEADSRIGFTFGDATISGAESDKAMADSIAAAGNVILLADATFTGDAPGVPPLVDEGYHLDVDGITERKVVYRPFDLLAHAAAGVGHNLFVLDALGRRVDEDLAAADVRLTMGGEPTFVSVDDMDGAEWNFTALGPQKRRLAGVLAKRLKQRFGPGGLLHHGQGKWYPGESLPRWALGCWWRKDDVPIWRDEALLADDTVNYGYGPEDAKQFVETLADTLGVEPLHAVAAHEDIWYYLWREEINCPGDQAS